MKWSALHLALVLGMLLGAIGFTGCGGTETGNPAHQEGPMSPGIGLQNPAVALLDIICKKVASCLPGIDEASCRLQAASSPTLGERFGADPGQFPTYIDVIAEVQLKTLLTDFDELEACVRLLSELRCDDEYMSVLEVSDDGTIGNLQEMIPTGQCQLVFSESQQ